MMTMYRSSQACDGCGRFAGYAGELYCSHCEHEGTAARLCAAEDARRAARPRVWIGTGVPR
jgi:uncharacterized Zn finger protein (UPF0148 family)